MRVTDWLVLIAGSGAFGSAAAATVLWLFKDMISVRLTRSVGHEFDTRLASLNSQLARKQTQEAAMLSTALGAVTAGQGTLQNARVRASKRLWAAMLRIRGCSTVAARLDILTADELRDAGQKHRAYLDRTVASDPLVADFTSELEKHEAVEEVRPLVSDLAWAYFFAYRAFTFRLIYLVQQYEKKGQFTSPFEDSGLNQIMRSVLSAQEIESANKLVAWRLHTVIGVIEYKLLSELRESMAGKHASEEALKHAHSILAAAQNITAQQDKAGKAP